MQRCLATPYVINRPECGRMGLTLSLKRHSGVDGQRRIDSIHILKRPHPNRHLDEVTVRIPKIDGFNRFVSRVRRYLDPVRFDSSPQNLEVVMRIDEPRRVRRVEYMIFGARRCEAVVPYVGGFFAADVLEEGDRTAVTG